MSWRVPATVAEVQAAVLCYQASWRMLWVALFAGLTAD